MPSANKSVVELVTAQNAHVTWVELDRGSRPTGESSSAPLVLLWGTRLFVWRTVSERGYFVFMEAHTIVSRTPSPGLASPDGSGPPPLGELP